MLPIAFERMSQTDEKMQHMVEVNSSNKRSCPRRDEDEEGHTITTSAEVTALREENAALKQFAQRALLLKKEQEKLKWTDVPPSIINQEFVLAAI
jgi:hypothetical protein